MEANKLYEIGIDYGNGKVNRDGEYRYGVISQNSISGDALGEFEPDYGEPSCPNCGGDVTKFDGDVHGRYSQYRNKFYNLSDYACTHCEIRFEEEDVWLEEPIGFSLNTGGYHAHHGTDGFGVWVTLSPYFTFARFCSLCAPGAGDLDSPLDDFVGPKVYCLGHEFFDGGKAPYKVWSVETQTIVNP